MEYHLNIGTNIGDRRGNLNRAIAALSRRFGALRVSSVVESEPWGYVSEASFLNQGVSLKTSMSPEELLNGLQEIERELSAVPHRNADGSYRDREVDIDIVDREATPYESERLHIPHRHLAERSFFLEPLCELRARRQIVVRGREVLLEGDDFPTAPAVSSLNPKGDIFRAGDYEGWEVQESVEAPAGCRFVDRREAWRLIGDERWSALSRISELCYWDSETQYCGRCGGEMERGGEVMKICRRCGAERFPRLAPAIVVLVTKGEEGLLVHGRSLRSDIHALVAGFVETGESLEETVRREIREETGLEVDDIRYYGSQSWPYPAQLMVAFTARWVSGEPHWVDGELTSGGFFHRDALPALPSLPSLSRRLIDAWIENRL